MSALAMWTVYDHPRDYPEGFIARRFEVTAGGSVATDSVMMADELDKLREVLLTQMGLTCITRQPEDDPVIVEVWL